MSEDRIDFGKEPWQAIPRSVLRDARLSAQAKGALVTLLSHEQGWVRSCIATLQRENRMGRVAARSAMRELAELGYAELEQSRGPGGRFTTGYTVYAVPKVVGSRGAGGQDTDPLGAGHTPAVVEALEVEPLEEETQDQERDLAFEEFWSIYPRHERKPRAFRAFVAALKRASKDEIFRGAARYRDDPNREAAFTAHPATWLNADGWEDDPLPPRQNGHGPPPAPPAYLASLGPAPAR